MCGWVCTQFIIHHVSRYPSISSTCMLTPAPLLALTKFKTFGNPIEKYIDDQRKTLSYSFVYSSDLCVHGSYSFGIS